jgi:GTPase SAR1 family protein
MGKEILKLLLLGNINSGKSSLTSQRARGNFSEEYTPTRGMNWVSLNKKEQKFLLVEISGQQQYQGFVF